MFSITHPKATNQMNTLATTTKPIFEDADYISIYTRSQAIEDGELVDVSITAQEAGISYPVAMTRAAYQNLVAWDNDVDGTRDGQDAAGRLWDVLYMFTVAIKRNKPGQELHYDLYRVPNRASRLTPRPVTPKQGNAERVTVKALVGPGDNFEPVITLMLPSED